MRFHGLLVVRDEADIIRESIIEALSWADSIWVIDTGSTDGTTDILIELSRQYSKLKVLGCFSAVFNQSIRSFLFNEARKMFDDGDWVVKLDADEFFHITPPKFVKEYVSESDGCVHLKWYYFRITKSEVESYLSGEIDLHKDRNRPIAERRRFFKLPKHSEPRMFRYRSSMRFRESDNAPKFAGLKCRHFIPIRHYPHRDPEQLQARFRLRSRMKSLGSEEGGHWWATDWRADVVDDTLGIEESYASREFGGLAGEAHHTDGPLLFWRDGDDLPNIAIEQSEDHGAARLVRWFFYMGFVRAADLAVRNFSKPNFLKNLMPDLQQPEDLLRRRSFRLDD